MQGYRPVFAWALMTLSVGAYLGLAISTQNVATKRVFLPGTTTHGHYQIELACNACHEDFNGVRQDACTDCHGADLKRDKDTHPASKFNDPTNADRLAVLDAQKCTTCHREHVPNRTGAMGLSLPVDYCFHCHSSVADQRPSHKGMKHDSCQSAGCHNYHDNQALYESFLFKNVDQADLLVDPKNPHRLVATDNSDLQLHASDADAPIDLLLRPIVEDWENSIHARDGVNCRDCHDVTSEDERDRTWVNQIGVNSCKRCHEGEAKSFMNGRHGMRLAVGLSPMAVSDARLPMHHESSHKTVGCSACHTPHRYDTKFAAADACISCHADQHSLNYVSSKHFELWQAELSGNAPHGSGVSCATCHLPRAEVDGEIVVEHNQNNNLRPNEKMIRSVCMNCHGLEFSLNALADPDLVKNCFAGQPSVNIDSAQMAKRWFEEKESKRQKK
ncbi:MAG: ammonia-forming cytochrome c nitrite reductase subunit c552 [Planctomycetales bacterium]|nr:ammonia-forming cytochrome c nitrite reductase subunit c552 [Planctomycetales bacterium]